MDKNKTITGNERLEKINDNTNEIIAVSNYPLCLR